MLRFIASIAAVIIFSTSAFAASPTTVVCTKDVWVKVADSVKSTRLWRKSSMPGKYLHTYRTAGDAAPTSAEEGVATFPLSESYSTGFPEFTDVYIRAVGAVGKVRVDAGSSPAVSIAGAVDVSVQDQTTATIILPMVNEIAATTITADTVVNEYTMTVADPTGFVVGQHIRIINAPADRYYYGEILGIAGSVITTDTQMDFIYISGSEVTISTHNLAVDGSVTPVVFVLRTGSPSIPSDVDITRIIIVCESPTAVNLGTFCGETALTRGLAFRRVNGIQSNIFNIKSGAEMTNIAYDYGVFAASNPNQGVDGFKFRLTFAGQDKVGVALRVGPAGNLHLIVQDDLTASTSITAYLEGHVVDP